MKYLKYFKTEEEYNTFIQSADFLLPNVTCVGDESVFYHVVATESGDYKIFLLEKKNISGLTYNMVDLGLPSGRLWADRNVGASSPEDFGTCFAWGETEGYNTSITYCTAAELCGYMQPLLGDDMELTPDNIEGVLSEMGATGKDMTTALGAGFTTDKCFSTDWSDYFDTTDGGSTFNKYATDKLTVLEASDDAATVNMGSEYRIPTEADFNELVDNCTATFIDLNDNEFSKSEAEGGSIAESLKGIKFTSSNGNSIFIPTSGLCYSSILITVYYCGNLWASSLDSYYSSMTYCFGFYVDGSFGFGSVERYYGLTVRGVK